LADEAEVAPAVTNTSNALLQIAAGPCLSPKDIAQFASIPLSCLQLDTYITTQVGVQPPVGASMPFDLHRHPSAATVVAQEMLDRLEEDVVGFAAQCAAINIPVLRVDLSSVRLGLFHHSSLYYCS
jgi:hypothetical protein